jgi:dihydroorotate dehydrogenase (fumarate)
MTASVLYKKGIDHLRHINKEIGEWMHRMDFDSIAAFKGVMSQSNISNPDAYERANYIKILTGAKGGIW